MPDPVLAMRTCLFTDEPLTKATQVEHTIPAKLGGRIRSRHVSSDAFNTCCGSTVDRDLIASYWMLMATLAPLLSREHQPGEQDVQIPGRPDRFVVNSKGALDGRGISITARDPRTGRPVAAAALDREAVLDVLRANMAPGSKIEESYEAPVKGRARMPSSALIAPALELAVLKAGLLTFDERLRTSDEPFTRSPALDPIRRAVRDIIMDDAEAADFLGTVSLGIQYEKLDLFRRLRAEASFHHSDFEHVLFASSNPPTRTLDLVVWLFGVDPYGFRLSSKWRGSGFVLVVVNGVLHGHQASGLIELPASETLCQATCRRSSHRAAPTDTEMRAGVEQIIGARSDAVRRATLLTIMRSDWFVRKSLYNTALPHSGQLVPIEDAVRDRLIALYEQRLENSVSRTSFDDAISRHLIRLPQATRKAAARDEAELDDVPWDTWVGVFRGIVRDLVPTLGLPGDVGMEPTINTPAGG